MIKGIKDYILRPVHYIRWVYVWAEKVSESTMSQLRKDN